MPGRDTKWRILSFELLWTVNVYVCVCDSRGCRVSSRTQRKTIRKDRKQFTCTLYVLNFGWLFIACARSTPLPCVCKMETIIIINTFSHPDYIATYYLVLRVFISKLFIANFPVKTRRSLEKRERERGREQRGDLNLVLKENEKNWAKDSHREFYCKFYHLLLLLVRWSCSSVCVHCAVHLGKNGSPRLRWMAYQIFKYVIIRSRLDYYTHSQRSARRHFNMRKWHITIYTQFK